MAAAPPSAAVTTTSTSSACTTQLTGGFANADGLEHGALESRIPPARKAMARSNTATTTSTAPPVACSLSGPTRRRISSRGTRKRSSAGRGSVHRHTGVTTKPRASKTRLFSINHQQNYGSDSHWELSNLLPPDTATTMYLLREERPCVSTMPPMKQNPAHWHSAGQA